MTLTPEDVAQVALLARLRVSPAEVEMFTEQLTKIVGFVEQLNELDTSNVEPLAHGVEVHNVFREDKVEPALPRAAALANAPEHNDECFIVPVVIE